MQTEPYNDVRTDCLIFADRRLTCKRSNWQFFKIKLDLPEPLYQHFDVMLAEGQHNEYLLNVHLYYGFSDQSGTEKGPKRNQKMSARDAGQVKQRIGYLANAEISEKRVSRRLKLAPASNLSRSCRSYNS